MSHSNELISKKIICAKCGKEFTVTKEKRYFYGKNTPRFCSHHCANSRIQTQQMNEARRIKLKGISTGPSPNKGKELVARINRKCANSQCNNMFVTLSSSNVKYCKKCSHLFMGGFRENSGRSKHGYYKGIYCGSTYELVWVIYNLDHHIKFSRFPTMLESNGVRYIPDFLIDNEIQEIKGFGDKFKIERKCQVARDNGYDIVVLYKKDIQYMFDYVISKYNTNKFYELYDTFIPKYTYTCCHCGKQYDSEVNKKTNKNFCSRSCAGKYIASLN